MMVLRVHRRFGIVNVDAVRLKNRKKNQKTFRAAESSVCEDSCSAHPASSSAPSALGWKALFFVRGEKYSTLRKRLFHPERDRPVVRTRKEDERLKLRAVVKIQALCRALTVRRKEALDEVAQENLAADRGRDTAVLGKDAEIGVRT